MQVNGSFDTKRIHELNSLNKLTGKEKMLRVKRLRRNNECYC